MRKKALRALITVALLFFVGCSATLKNVNAYLSSPSQTVKTGQTLKITAMLGGDVYSTDLQWSVNSVVGGTSTIGTISGTGLYTAPQSVPNPAVVTITAEQIETNKHQGKTFAGASINITITGATNTTPTASISVSPSSISAGQSATLTWSSSNVTSCTINGQSSVNGAAIGTSGSATVSPSQTASFRIDCSGPNGAVTNSTTLTVGSSGSTGVSISPSTGTMESNQTQNFSANVPVTWTSTFGAAPVSTGPQTATYTAPIVSANATAKITATSVADPTQSATATITITPETVTTGFPTVGVQPTSKGLDPGGTQVLVASASGAGVPANPTFTWTLIAGQGVKTVGTLTQTTPGSNTATYTAPNIPDLVTVQIKVICNEVGPNTPAYSTITSAKPTTP